MAFIPPYDDLVICEACGPARLHDPEAWHGWWCFECENAVAWMEPESQALVFSRNAVCFYTGHGNRIRINRFIDWCILCHDTRGSILDRAGYHRYFCFQCSMVLQESVWQRLTQRASFTSRRWLQSEFAAFLSFLKVLTADTLSTCYYSRGACRAEEPAEPAELCTSYAGRRAWQAS